MSASDGPGATIYQIGAYATPDAAEAQDELLRTEKIYKRIEAQRRVELWRARMRGQGLYYSIRVHEHQLANGIDWTHRDEHGRLRPGLDGYLPRLEP